MRTAVRSVAFVLLAMAVVGLVVLLTPSLPTLPDASGAVAAGGDGAPSSLRGGLAAAPVATDERTNERTSAPAIAAGATVKSDASGRAITWVTSGARLGVALEPASAAGQFIEVLLIQNAA